MTAATHSTPLANSTVHFLFLGVTKFCLRLFILTERRLRVMRGRGKVLLSFGSKLMEFSLPGATPSPK
jgi:hypothetical protein